MPAILHVDMDAFFASIEQRDHPEWRGRPVIVGAPPDRRGVVSTCSYEARKFGVHSAMPSREAGRLCPQGIFVPPDMAHYHAVSQQVFEIFNRYTPLVEPVSVDEAFLDVTGAVRLFGTPVEIAGRIRDDLRRELHLTGSVGVAHNMFLAKLGSDMHKPDGLTVVPDDPAALQAFLDPLPVGRLWGVGKVTNETLRTLGIRTVRDLRRESAAYLEAKLGANLAHHLLRLAAGEDDRALDAGETAEQSISREHTFDVDVTDRALLVETLHDLAYDVARRVRDRGVFATVARIKLRWSDFRTITRQVPFSTPSCDDLTFRDAADALWSAAYAGGAVRLLGFGVSGLVDERVEQGFLFDDPAPQRDRREALSHTLDNLRKKLGDGRISFGSDSGCAQ